MGNSVTADLLLQIVHCWRVYQVDEEKRSLPMVMYLSVMMYKHYYCI